MSDARASQVSRWIVRQAYTADTLREICYLIEQAENAGELTIRCTEEIDEC